jgi:antirestriction protein ArdC
MPPFSVFNSASTYYGTLFHELIHWTGHPSRLARDLSGRFTSPDQRYAAEELVAELGNAFLCAGFDIDGYSEHASYIASWAELLTSDIKAIFTCSSRAQQAVDYLRDLVLREPAQAAAE